MAGLDRLWKNKLLLIKKETTAGVDSIPVAATDSMLGFNVALTLDADEKTRNPDKGYFAASEKSYTNKKFTLTFDLELAGSGTAGTAPAIGPALIMCGMSETIVAVTSVEYKPVSGSTETASIYLNIDGTLYKALSCKGSIKINPAIDDYSKASVTVTGLYLAPADAALVPGVFTNFIAPVDCTKETCELSVNSVLVDGRSFSYDQGNDNQLKQSTETKVIANVDRQGSAEITCWINPQATFNPYSLFEAHTKVPVYWTSGIVAGNICKVTLPSAQLGAPQVGDLDGVAGYTIPLTPHSTTGDNEFNIFFT